ncbi:glycoside hydrolase family 88 protein [Pelagicoccus sp. NFK12]|uniref:Glycoside hydrolase family 88 protein n=1 Tax=Pelagicoccus enzymogenes TaxID=2773457 RepID=A0A927FAX7_9BACT|nr:MULTISPECIES: glycoside hydrolase family 88 protein [Pelagicoccus]MBD5781612.1 glycoside hydrolase family 88 protein [Pelagicoccus enzymogenes]MDQ8181132.1 glycoside hydrolase family 88 protein [Pelagicoccus sp. SDUM812005]
MPKDIVERPAKWNFGPGALQSHAGWQYAAFWDDQRQVTVARRRLPGGSWHAVSLTGYQRTENGDRGKVGPIARGFGDGHEKVALGISADGYLHLSFDHHGSTLRYRKSLHPVARSPENYSWNDKLFGPVQDNLGGPKIEGVTYPSFANHGKNLSLYLRLNGGSGSADSCLFEYSNGKWFLNDPAQAKIIDKSWSRGNKTVNAYPHSLATHNGRRHLTWCWRDSPKADTTHDLCYAYSDDQGNTWKDNEGNTIGIRGNAFITADTQSAVVWSIPSGTKFVNGGSMTVDASGRVHVLMKGEDGSPAYFQRNPTTGQWSRQSSPSLGSLAAHDDRVYLVTPEGIESAAADSFAKRDKLASGPATLFEDSKIQVDRSRADGWISVIGQTGKTVSVVDYWIGRSDPPEERPSLASVRNELSRVADWQIEHFGEVFDNKHRKRPYTANEWPAATLMVGMEKWAEISEDPRYYRWLIDLSENMHWKLRPARFYHADDHCIGQLYLSLYQKFGDKSKYKNIVDQFDKIIAKPSTVPLTWNHRIGEDRWSWCDSLFMAPPVWAKLSSVTGNPKYRDWMFDEYKAITELLFDPTEDLYFRDTRFIEQRHNGSKIFWARGNGWVFGGLAELIPELPKNSEQHRYFVDIYKKMARRIAYLQTPNGHWAMSLLEADTYPTPETSGTGFYCFGLAWGINAGILDRDTYEPVVLKAWGALARSITPEGMLGYVQPIGAEPGSAWPDRTEVYGTGAFLAAGAELTRLLKSIPER